jgi:cation transport protein ChaC
VKLRREHLSPEAIEAVVAAGRRAGVDVLGREEREHGRRAFLSALRPGEDAWLFGYGSLMWNPAFRFAERRVAHLRGWHRRFGLWSPLGRGTPERPGLVLCLDRGGSCRGLAFRIAAEDLESELALVWAREQLTAAYAPRWVALETGGGRVSAITFVANRAHARYAGRLGLGDAARALAEARGFLGTGLEYLESTVAELEALGIPDRTLVRLLRTVRAREPV